MFDYGDFNNSAFAAGTSVAASRSTLTVNRDMGRAPEIMLVRTRATRRERAEQLCISEIRFGKARRG